MRIGGERPLMITVSATNGTHHREYTYDRPGSVIHFINHRPGRYNVVVTGRFGGSVIGSFQVPQVHIKHQ